jgi:L-asparaginase
MSTALPKIAVLALGGTIASRKGPDGMASPKLSAQELIADLPELAEVATVTAVSVAKLASFEIALPDIVSLARRLARMAGEMDGLVVTQGTDTLEESAFVLDILWTPSTPIVVTGALRHLDAPGSDGPANLLAAVRVAASASARGLGSVVVMNDEVHMARFVQKAHTFSPSAFRSRVTGPIGWIVEGRVRIAARPAVRNVLALDAVGNPEAARVALVTTSMGDEGGLLDGIVQTGYTGLVVEGMGGGHVRQEFRNRAVKLAKAMPVVLASRTGAGEGLRETYGGFPGSEVDLLEHGFIWAGALDGLKAHLLLTLLLCGGADLTTVREVFAVFGALSPDPGLLPLRQQLIARGLLSEPTYD